MKTADRQTITKLSHKLLSEDLARIVLAFRGEHTDKVFWGWHTEDGRPGSPHLLRDTDTLESLKNGIMAESYLLDDRYHDTQLGCGSPMLWITHRYA